MRYYLRYVRNGKTIRSGGMDFDQAVKEISDIMISINLLTQGWKRWRIGSIRQQLMEPGSKWDIIMIKRRFGRKHEITRVTFDVDKHGVPRIVPSRRNIT